MENNVYTMAINNTSRFIRSQNIEDGSECISAFVAAKVLAAAFAKLQHDVLMDLIKG